MHSTHHIRQRMSQRGVNQSMVNFTLEFGEIEQDRYVMTKRDALRQIQRLQEQLQVAKKIADKGGMVVVSEGDSLITTYNFSSRS